MATGKAIAMEGGIHSYPTQNRDYDSLKILQKLLRLDLNRITLSSRMQLALLSACDVIASLYTNGS
jgi:hypothetical protein